jgi:hypothetical protein
MWGTEVQPGKVNRQVHTQFVLLYEFVWAPKPSWMTYAMNIFLNTTVGCRIVAIQAEVSVDFLQRRTVSCGIESWERV